MSESNFPAPPVAVDHVEPSPRRVRGRLDGAMIFDTTRAVYVWEVPYYPQYYVPVADVGAGVLTAETGSVKNSRGTVVRHGLRVGGNTHADCADVYGEDALAPLRGMVRIDFDALDAWFEEDEEIFKHPRNPFSRVDAVTSTRTVRVELDGAVLAESSAPVMVFETGLPTRYYLNRTEVDLAYLRETATESICPYKGKTSQYWSVVVGGTTHEDLAWAYDYPVGALLPIAGKIAFYNEKVDIFIDGTPTDRAHSHFFAEDGA